ncbi:MAG: trypsin-like serine protease [Pseudomonadota bacterium]
MLVRKLSVKKLVGLTLVAGAFLATASAQAGIIKDGEVTAVITAGALPDTPAAHVDANNAASPYSGVVSINIRYGTPRQSFICSGALVGKRTVVSAGHCVDTNGNGALIDINAPGNDVRVVFNSSGSFNAIMTATKVSMNPDYKGFNICPDSTVGCLNDDVAVITLGADAPASAKIYKIATNEMLMGTQITMAGYGTTGNGTTGYGAGPAFDVKRTGQNVTDLFDRNDELGFTGDKEVYYADFDGAGKDTFCTNYGVCTAQLANDKESGIGGGDSGGPSFVNMYGELMLATNNTFSGRFSGQVAGSFGTYFGGMILGSYEDYLSSVSSEIQFVPEPGSFALFGLGALALIGARRRRSAK